MRFRRRPGYFLLGNSEPPFALQVLEKESLPLAGKMVTRTRRKEDISRWGRG